MGLRFAADVKCDKCGEQKATMKVAITKLKPQVEMHLRLPEGWAVSSLAESGEMLITCPWCPPTLLTGPPPPSEETTIPAPPPDETPS